MSRRTMLAPMRPKPIMPICICWVPPSFGEFRIIALMLSLSGSACKKSCCESNESSANNAVQIRKSAGHVFAEMDAKSAAIAFGKDGEITAGLRRFHDTKGVFPAGNGQIHSVVASDLQKHTAVWAAFVSLSRGMQKARAETETSGDALAIANDMADFLQRAFIRIIHLDVREHSEVIVDLEAAEMRADMGAERLV